MPRRTNDFQELVSMVQRALAPAGAKVTDSLLVDVPGMPEAREIDVLIESEVGPYRIKIAVEARKQNRKLDSSQFESIVGKYKLEGGVKVDKVVIITHRGFYEPVIQRAKQLGVELFTLKQSKRVAWSTLRPRTLEFAATPHLCNIKTLPEIKDCPPNEVLNYGQVQCSHGHNFGSLRRFAHSCFLRNIVPSKSAELRQPAEAAVNSPNGTRANAQLTMDHPHTIQVHNKEYQLKTLTFDVHFSNRRPVSPSDSEFHVRKPPHLCTVMVSPLLNAGTPNEIRREGRLICKCCGKDRGTIDDYCQRIFKDQCNRDPNFVQIMEQKAASAPSGNCRWRRVIQLGKRYRIRYRDADHEFDNLEVGVHAVSAKAKAECTTYELQSSDGEETLLSHFQAIAGGMKASLLIPHGEGISPDKIVLKIENVSQQPKPPIS